MTIQVNFPAGTDIKDAAGQAIKLAKALSQLCDIQIGVTFDFNETKCWAFSHNKIEQIVEHYHNK